MNTDDESRALRRDYAWLYSREERATARRIRKTRRAARRHAADAALTVPAGELVALTDRERPSAQARVLARLGIPHRRRPDGSLIVLRCHLETIGAGRAIVRAAEPQLVL